MNASLSGIIGACLTPFGEAGKVDFGALQREIDFIVADADAISLGAVEAAEYTMLDLPERRELLRQGRSMVQGRLPTILGVSSPTPAGVLELADFAAGAGADLVQVLIPSRPWGGPPTTAELVTYFQAIAQRSPLPLVVYHNPGPGADPSVEAMVALSQIDNIHSFKESSRDITRISRLIEDIDRAGHARYFTTMQPLLITLLMGGSGATMPPPGTRIGARVVKAFRDGDIPTAVAWQRHYSHFPGRWANYGLPPVMKAAMKLFDVDLGEPAPPYAPVSQADAAAIAAFLQQTGLLADAKPKSANRVGSPPPKGTRPSAPLGRFGAAPKRK